MNKYFISLLSSLAIISLAALGNVSMAKTVWDLPSAYPDSNMHTELLNAFIKDVAHKTNGELVIKLHSNASLFKAPEIKRAVQSNQAQIGEILLNNYANESPIFELDGLPFLATGYDASWKLYQAQKPFLEKKLASQGLKLLYTVPWPPQGTFVNTKLNSVKDLKGLKWRAYSPVTARIAKLVQANPVTIQQAELSQALATGVINSLMTSSATGYDIKIYEQIKYFYDMQAWLPKNAVIVNQRAFNSLSTEQQAALLAAAQETEQSGWQISPEKTKWFKDEMQKNGLQIIKPSAELTTGLSAVGKIMLDEWLKKAGADGQKIIDDYNQQ